MWYSQIIKLLDYMISLSVRFAFLLNFIYVSFIHTVILHKIKPKPSLLQRKYYLKYCVSFRKIFVWSKMKKIVCKKIKQFLVKAWSHKLIKRRLLYVLWDRCHVLEFKLYLCFYEFTWPRNHICAAIKLGHPLNIHIFWFLFTIY